MTAEPTEKPDLRVTCTTDIWVALFMRQLDVGAALRQRVIVLEATKACSRDWDAHSPAGGLRVQLTDRRPPPGWSTKRQEPACTRFRCDRMVSPALRSPRRPLRA